ncbi:arrestin domain-containing protein 3 [Anoplophora glabripennis]|uniref:arrestin domain-containing protein 3 n=1 Tax=Anoplophora glabripennis TaxID=217634 RepID=UPI00087535C2|nr:arrestin domain-containing protein 3 [Anoplophora glabripennis]XP_018576811.1 arrestin domain-containing protein 3 [Anoplophora glabripennis]XP_018576817.1 arrestin domain-containing protein 3 [Anoplophora glabripennis]
MSCDIQLDNYQGQYYPGDSIMGKVICSFDESINIRGIILKLKGDERNAWTRRRKKKTVHCKGHNRFLYVENSLHGEGDIGPGRYEYPFTFQLPHNLPSTYQGHYGGVTFILKVKVDRPYRFDYTDSIEVIVASPINLNQMREALWLEPSSYSVDKDVCCWCCTSGPITMEVHLQKEAFVVGEVAKMRVDITNMSNKSIESVRVKLKMEVKSMVTHPRDESKSNSELLATNSDTGVGAHGQRSYDLNLEIPQSAQVPNFEQCVLFSQKTKLEVTAVLPGCHTNLKAVAYVTIGHIPIDGFNQNLGHEPKKHPPDTAADIPPYAPGPIGFINPQEATAAPSAPPSEGGPSAPPKKEAADDFGPSELPPPSYNEAVSHTQR